MKRGDALIFPLGCPIKDKSGVLHALDLENFISLFLYLFNK